MGRVALAELSLTGRAVPVHGSGDGGLLGILPSPRYWHHAARSRGHGWPQATGGCGLDLGEDRHNVPKRRALVDCRAESTVWSWKLCRPDQSAPVAAATPTFDGVNLVGGFGCQFATIVR